MKRLKFRSIGPAAGGRVCRAAGVPGDPLTYYAATAGGGVWKSTDGGIRWKSIFDKQLDSSAGSLAISPSDPNVIYVGAGEANIRGNVEGDMPVGMMLAFTKGGKLTVTDNVGGRRFSFDHTYAVHGDKLQMIFWRPDDEKEESVTDTITKLTDKELHLKDSKGRKTELKRKK